MPGITRRTVPHCGTVRTTGTLQHACARLTRSRRARCVGGTGPERPAPAVSARRYNARRSMFDAQTTASPCSTTAVHGRCLRGVWTSCADPTVKPNHLNPPTRPADGPATCPHCGMESTAAAIGRHASTCLADPANYALPGAADG